MEFFKSRVFTENGSDRENHMFLIHFIIFHVEIERERKFSDIFLNSSDIFFKSLNDVNEVYSDIIGNFVFS